jgi:hypothetical protein
MVGDMDDSVDSPKTVVVNKELIPAGRK